MSKSSAHFTLGTAPINTVRCWLLSSYAACLMFVAVQGCLLTCSAACLMFCWHVLCPYVEWSLNVVWLSVGRPIICVDWQLQDWLEPSSLLCLLIGLSIGRKCYGAQADRVCDYWGSMKEKNNFYVPSIIKSSISQLIKYWIKNKIISFCSII